MKHLPQVIDEDRDRQRAEKLGRATREAEAYWNETAPCGALPVKAFTLADGIELLLYDLRRYQAAVARVFEKERDQEALLEHKAATGQEVGAAQQRWLACRDVMNAVRQALDTASPSGEAGKEKP